MSEPWNEVASRISHALEGVDRLLEREECWRALKQLEAREAAGDRLEAVEGPRVRAGLQQRLATLPAYQIRERLLEGQRLVNRCAAQPSESVGRKAPGMVTEAAACPRLPRDDLTRLKGIDGLLAKKLAGMGIEGYATIAAWGARDVRRVADALGLGKRISRENWIEQAAVLMARAPAPHATGAITAEPTPVPSDVPEPANAGQRLVQFTGIENAVAPQPAVSEFAGSPPQHPLARDILVLGASHERPVAHEPLVSAAVPPDLPVLAPPTEHVPEPAADITLATPAPLVAAAAAGGPDDSLLQGESSDADTTEEEPPLLPPTVEEPALLMPAVERAQSAAIFAAPLSAVVPFIAPEVAPSARAVAPQAPPADPPPTRPAPMRAASPREVLSPRAVPPPRAPEPERSVQSRSSWNAPSDERNEPTVALKVAEAEVEIVRRTPTERPTPRPEPPRGRLPKRTATAPPLIPRGTHKDVQPAEVVIVPRDARPRPSPDPEGASAGRLDISRMIASWRGR